MRKTTFAIGLVSLAFAVSTSVLAQTPANTEGKNVPRVQTSESQAALTPASALEKLKKGNARFVEKNMRNRDWLAKVSATATGQYPFAVVLACMDSRAPVEIIFDQGIGDVFGIRIAGNIVNEDVLGSMEYATKVVGSKLLNLAENPAETMRRWHDVAYLIGGKTVVGALAGRPPSCIPR